MFERRCPTATPLSAALADQLRATGRAENRAAGQRLAVIGELDVMWLRRFGERETWCTDTQEAITAEIAAALEITQGLAASYLEYSRAMRLRLPRVGEVLVAGDIDYRTFQTIVYRTDLITDSDVLAAVGKTATLRPLTHPADAPPENSPRRVPTSITRPLTARAVPPTHRTSNACAAFIICSRRPS